MNTRVGSLVHHARNRIAGLIGRIEAGEAEAPALVGELHRVAGQLASAMALLRLQQPEPAFSPHEVELDLFFADLADEVRGLTPPQLRTDCAADFSSCLFPTWTFDAQLVRLALLDALMNAWRHARATVRLRAEVCDGSLAFTVRDDGPGFPPEMLAGGAVAVPQGTGNGLRLAAEIAERHILGARRGRIELANEGGAVFRLRLP